MLRKAGDFMAWLGGADREILNQVPQERSRFAQMAGVLLTTSGIAVFSMTFALHSAVGAPLAVAIILGLLWGVIILNLDRFLVLSMGFTRERRRLFWIAAPRFALAVVLALVISTPLVLRIFASDINEQLAITHRTESKQLAGLEANSGEAQQAGKLLRQINADKKILDGQLPEAVTSPQLQTAQAQVGLLQPQAQSAQTAVITAREAWQCELYGDGPNCAGASNRVGSGPIAQAKYQQYQQAVANYDSIAAKLQTAQNAENAAERTLRQSQGAALARYQAQARTELPGLQTQYAALETKLANIAKSDQNATNGNNGLLAQLSALFTASGHNFALVLAHLTVLALFFLIEILPVSVKLLLNLGDPTAYEIAAKLREDKLIDSVRIQRTESRRREEGQSEARLNVEDDMRKREEELGKRANAHVASHMEGILDAALQEWAERVRARLYGDSVSANGNPSGNGSSPHMQTQVNPGFGLPPDGGQL